MKTYLLIISLLICSHIQAQDDYIYHNWNKLKYDSVYSVSYNTKNTEDRFHRDGSLTRNDWCCEFSLDQTTDVFFSHCGSGIEDTYLTLLDEQGNIIGDNDDNMGNIDPVFGIGCEHSSQAQLYKQLPAGAYSIYSEGVCEDGDISLTIYTKKSNIGIDGMANPIDLGVLDKAFPVLSLKDSREYKNSYSFGSNDVSGDVVYRFEIQKTMKLIITIDGGIQPRVALLDSDRKFLKKPYWGVPPEEVNKQKYFLNENFTPGIYYLVCSTYNNYECPISTYFNTRNLPVEPQNPLTQNFVETHTSLRLSDDKYSGLTTIKYYDGLGRESVTVQKNITSNDDDLVTSQKYDKVGRKSDLSLPVPYHGYGYYLEPKVVSFLSRVYYNDEHAYIEQQYDNSPLNKATKQYGAGESWYDNNKCIKTDYLLNEISGEHSCAFYRVINDKLQKTGFYNPNELSIEKATDEDNNYIYTFADKENRIVLNRQICNNIPHDTYYVYDDFGNLRYVLPPIAADSLTENTIWDFSNKILKSYAYYYAYDYRNRKILKRLPGCEPIRYVYDAADRLILTQDGIQRTKNEWTFCIPDYLGREAIKGTCILTKVGDYLRTPVYAKYNAQISWLQTGYQTFNLAENSLSMDSIAILNVNYYDNYRFLDLPEFAALKNEMLLSSTKLLAEKYTYLINGIDFSAKGVVSGSKTALLNTTENPIFQAIYYDKKQQPLLSVASNHLGGYEKFLFKYNFTGKPLQYLHEHTAVGKSRITELYEYTYEYQSGRLLKTTHQLNDGEVITLAENSYDELGRLESKKLHGGVDAENYSYNIRNWVTGINSDRYKQNLFYEKPFSGSTPYYNGNINAINWLVKNDIQRVYKYSYDDLDRMLAAEYSEIGQRNPETMDTASDPSYDEKNLKYDKHGNIKQLFRTGIEDKTSINKEKGLYQLTHSNTDYIDFEYNGNQLVHAEDSGIDGIYEGTEDYPGCGDIYTYDLNGNVTAISIKELMNIKYNLLNLPSTMQYSLGHTVSYLYDANGIKRNVKYTVTDESIVVPIGTTVEIPKNHIVSQTSTDYCDNVIYENGVLNMILTNEGFITMNGAVPTYHYYLKDHQGNNRVVFNQNGVIEQTNHYYPSGTAFGEGVSISEQRYKYNGKELDKMNGLNWYDYGARHYDASIVRWGTMDPLAEKYYSISPYAYCANNPIRFIDPQGEDIDIWYYDAEAKAGTFFSFDGENYKDAPDNLFVRSFLAAYYYNTQNGGGDKMKEAATNNSLSIKLYRGDETAFHRLKNSEGEVIKTYITWNPFDAIQSEDGKYTMSPATALEHEIDHELSYIENPDRFKKRENTYDRQYQNKEERRVITGSEAKTARANGEFSKGHVRQDHDSGTFIKVPSSVSNSPYLLPTLKKLLMFLNR